MKTFTLPQLAAELDMTAKAARAILRKNGLKRPGTRWSWGIEDKAKIRAMLKGKPMAVAKKTPKRPSREDAHVH